MDRQKMIDEIVRLILEIEDMRGETIDISAILSNAGI